METIPARRGKAAYVKQGQSIRIVNTHGSQVVDTWAFTAGMLTEFMSMEHTRATLTKLIPRPGDGLYTNRRRKILTMTEDTSLGAHDTLMAACDSERYILLGVKEYHDNCTDNLFAAMQGLGLDAAGMPEPAQPLHEHPVDAERQALVRSADQQARRLRHPARRARLHRRHVGLPAGHPADQRHDRQADRGALRDHRLVCRALLLAQTYERQ